MNALIPLALGTLFHSANIGSVDTLYKKYGKYTVGNRGIVQRFYNRVEKCWRDTVSDVIVLMKSLDLGTKKGQLKTI